MTENLYTTFKILVKIITFGPMRSFKCWGVLRGSLAEKGTIGRISYINNHSYNVGMLELLIAGSLMQSTQASLVST